MSDNEVDNVRHHDGDECMRVIESIQMGYGFCIGSAIKYLWRQGRKHPNWKIDIEKARWYLRRASSLEIGADKSRTVSELLELCSRVDESGGSCDVRPQLRRIGFG